MAQAGTLTRKTALELSASMRDMSENATCMEDVANRIVRLLYEHLRDAHTGEPICALARLFRTLPFEQLEEPLRRIARQTVLLDPILSGTRCLTLLATAGDRPEWNARQTSSGHQAIPLTSEEVVLQSPMISRLIGEFGVPVKDVIKPDPNFLLPTAETTYNIFYIPDAVGSPYVPAQDQFVRPYGVRSVIGFGGPLTSGDFFACILFTKVKFDTDAAALFRGIALSAKLALLPFANGPIFA